MSLDTLVLETAYRDAAQNILETIQRKNTQRGSSAYERSVLLEVAKILSGLNDEARDWVEKTIPAEYLTASAETAASLNIIGEITQLDRQAIQLLVANATGELLETNAHIGRRVADLLRTVGIESVTTNLTQGLSASEVKKTVLKRLVTEGLLSVPDSLGRRWDARAYANMVGRSTTAEARNVGRVNTMTQTGNDLVYIVPISSTCPICSAYEGRVYSVSGNDKRFPALYETAWRNGYSNIHPNCRHTLAPWIENLKTTTEIREAKRSSNLSFDVDRRSESQRKSYADAVAKKRQIRADKMQYERYSIVMGKDAPRTFAAFMRIKNADGTAWQTLQQKYRQIAK